MNVSRSVLRIIEKLMNKKKKITVLIQVTIATSYYPSSLSPCHHYTPTPRLPMHSAQHQAADILQPLMWWLLQEDKQSSASLGAGCLSSVREGLDRG